MDKTEAGAAPSTVSTASQPGVRGRGRPRKDNPRTRKVEAVVKDAFGNPVPTTGRPGRPVKRAALRPDQAIGRNGEILTRNRVSGDGYRNEFDIPEDARDPDYDLYWARSTTHGKPDPANINELYENGWRPASPKNYRRVMPDMASRETIERDGLILMERPMKLSMQALEEQRQIALELREIQSDAFGNRKLPQGFDKGRRSRDGKFNASKMLNRTLEQAPKEARPTYEYATPGDDD